MERRKVYLFTHIILPGSLFLRFQGSFKKIISRDFPGGPVIKNLPSSAGDTGLIPGRGTKSPYAVGQPSLCTAAREVGCCSEDPVQPIPLPPQNLIYLVCSSTHFLFFFN